MENKEAVITDTSMVALMLVLGCEPIRNEWKERFYAYVFDAGDFYLVQRSMNDEALRRETNFIKVLKSVQEEVAAARRAKIIQSTQKPSTH
jgi:hypothetical protein